MMIDQIYLTFSPFKFEKKQAQACANEEGQQLIGVQNMEILKMNVPIYVTEYKQLMYNNGVVVAIYGQKQYSLHISFTLIPCFLKQEKEKTTKTSP